MGSNRLRTGINDLASHNPELVREWDEEKNGHLKPEGVAYGSAKKVWWKCSRGHSWQASLNGRTSNKTGCPICSGHQVLQGFNDIASVRPDIAAEWDYERNAPFRPEGYTIYANRKVWWKCRKGHVWQTTPGHRAEGTGCPYCVGKKVIPEEGSLMVLKPDLMREWDFEKNAGINPQEISRGSNRKVWWRCRQGHSWQAVISSRSLSGNGCPYCGGTRVLKGFNDVETTRPDLMEEWDYDRNIGLDPGCFGTTARAVVWWKCKNGHRWISAIGYRSTGNGCPHCSGKVPMRLRLV